MSRVFPDANSFFVVLARPIEPFREPGFASTLFFAALRKPHAGTTDRSKTFFAPCLIFFPCPFALPSPELPCVLKFPLVSLVAITGGHDGARRTQPRTPHIRCKPALGVPSSNWDDKGNLRSKAWQWPESARSPVAQKFYGLSPLLLASIFPPT